MQPSLWDRFGLVLYADWVTIKSIAHQLLLLATGLVCVSTSTNAASNQRQEFTGIIFAEPLSELAMPTMPNLLSLKFRTVHNRVVCKAYFMSNAKRNEMKRRFRQAKYAINNI